VAPKGRLGVAGFVLSCFVPGVPWPGRGSAREHGAACRGSGPGQSLPSKVMLLKPGDPIWHRDGGRGCPEPSSLPGRGAVGAEWDPLRPTGPISCPLLSPFAYVSRDFIIFLIQEQAGQSLPASPPSHTAAWHHHESPVPSPRGAGAVPAAPHRLGPPGDSTHAVTLSRRPSEHPASSQGTLG